MAQIATAVLHNVGNVLNSVNVSAALVAQGVKKSKASNLGRVVDLLDQHAPDLGDFVTNHARGRHLPAYLRWLGEQTRAEQAGLLEEVELLRQKIDHINEIVATQQGFARAGGEAESLRVLDLVEEALRIGMASAAQGRMAIARDYRDDPVVRVERGKALQILVNLLRNAQQACAEGILTEPRISVRVSAHEAGIEIAVKDNGIGIPAENLTRIFGHGFTTRKEGHGFGLHSCERAAAQLGGSLAVESDGRGFGATFTLKLPAES
jgi:C4-dicarboxylate-specific signal transduction histidine kinase